MSILAKIPTCLFKEVITEWLFSPAWSYVDTALCNKELRRCFLSFLSHESFLVVDSNPLKENFRYQKLIDLQLFRPNIHEQYSNWLILKNVGVRNIQIITRFVPHFAKLGKIKTLEIFVHLFPDFSEVIVPMLNLAVSLSELTLGCDEQKLWSLPKVVVLPFEKIGANIFSKLIVLKVCGGVTLDDTASLLVSTQCSNLAQLQVVSRELSDANVAMIASLIVLNAATLQDIDVRIPLLMYSVLLQLLKLLVSRHAHDLIKRLKLSVAPCDSSLKTVDQYLPLELVDQLLVNNPNIRSLNVGYYCYREDSSFSHLCFDLDHSRCQDEPHLLLHSVKVLQNVFIQSCKSLCSLTLSHLHVTSDTLVSVLKLHGPTLSALHLRYILGNDNNLLQNLFSDSRCCLSVLHLTFCGDITESDHVKALKTQHRTCRSVSISGKILSAVNLRRIRESNPLLSLNYNDM
jgi:hypothetical protein